MKTGHDLFPSDHSVSKSKQMCDPPEVHIVVTKTRAEVKL